MLIRLFSFVCLGFLGGCLLAAGVQEWRQDDARHASVGHAVVAAHSLVLDRERWDESEPEAVRVETRMVLDREDRFEAVAKAYFQESEDAWRFMLAHPVGSRVRCLVDPSGTNVAWPRVWGSTAVWLGGIGLVLLGIGVCQLLRWPRVELPDEAKPVLFCLIFLACGIVTARTMWPAMVTQVRAADWERIPCTSVEKRSFSPGKGSITQFAFRYDWQGNSYHAVQNAAASSGPEPIQCRVNPKKPWQAVVQWGWRPGLGVALLFPIPFLTVGLFAFIIPCSGRMRKFLQEARTYKAGRGVRPPPDRATSIGTLLFAIFFAGPIMGVFLCAGAELRLADSPHKWVMLFLVIPFLAVLYAFQELIRNVWKAWRNP